MNTKGSRGNVSFVQIDMESYFQLILLSDSFSMTKFSINDFIHVSYLAQIMVKILMKRCLAGFTQLLRVLHTLPFKSLQSVRIFCVPLSLLCSARQHLFD